MRALSVEFPVYGSLLDYSYSVLYVARCKVLKGIAGGRSPDLCVGAWSNTLRFPWAL